MLTDFVDYLQCEVSELSLVFPPEMLEVRVKTHCTKIHGPRFIETGISTGEKHICHHEENNGIQAEGIVIFI